MSDHDEEVIDLHAMKVTELKQELKARGLTVSGTKADLITRLENYMKEHEGVEVVEEDVEDLEESVEEATPPKKEEEAVSAEGKEDDSKGESGEIVQAASPPPPNCLSMAEEDEEPAATAGENALKNMSESDRKQARAGRFASGTVSGTTTDELKKKTERASRFGLPVNAATKEKADNTTKTTEKSDRLKLRADRFGMKSDRITGPPDTDAKRLKARAERFGNSITKSVTAAVSERVSGTVGGMVTTGLSDKERAAKRAARFGTN